MRIDTILTTVTAMAAAFAAPAAAACTWNSCSMADAPKTAAEAAARAKAVERSLDLPASHATPCRTAREIAAIKRQRAGDARDVQLACLEAATPRAG